MNIRQRFPDEETLRQYLQEKNQFFVDSIRQQVGHLEAQYYDNLRKSQAFVNRRRVKGLVLLLGSVLCLSFVYLIANTNNYFLGIVGVMAILAGITFVRVGWQMVRSRLVDIDMFKNSDINDIAYPLVLDIFGLTGQRAAHSMKSIEWLDEAIKNPDRGRLLGVWHRAKTDNASPQQDAVLRLLDHSELITTQKDVVLVDDMVSITYNDRPLFLAEITAKSILGKDNDKRVSNIFHGYFVSFDLPRALTGKTFVSTEGDKKGFGHQSFFKSMKGKGVQKTELEWNDFEDKLHVVTDNPSEARYVLTPDFMSDLYDWWQGKKENIRLSFIANRMYVLFPDKGVRMGKTIKKIDSGEMQMYLESIAVPLLHVLHLIEDLET